MKNVDLYYTKFTRQRYGNWDEKPVVNINFFKPKLNFAFLWFWVTDFIYDSTIAFSFQNWLSNDFRTLANK